MPLEPAVTRLTPLQSFYLDFIRAAAALCVLFGHASIYFLHGGWLDKALIQIFGVLVFFLLSGFLITHSVIGKHADTRYDGRTFFIDRFTRIYTAFVPALLFVATVDHISIPMLGPVWREDLAQHFIDLQQNADLKSWFGNLFMLQNFPVFPVLRKLGVDSDHLIGQFGSAVPFWTISIEWWIYMAFGLLVVGRLKTGKPFAAWQWPILAFVMIVPLYHAMGGYDECLTLLWLVGMAAAWLFAKANGTSVPQVTTARRRFIAITILVAGLFLMAGRVLSTYIDTKTIVYAEFQFGVFLAMALFAPLFLMSSKRVLPSLIVKPVKFIADYSFSLYLTHFTVIVCLYLLFPYSDYDPHLFWLSILLSNIVAIPFWWLFERHYRTLGRWLKRVTAPAPALSEPS